MMVGGLILAAAAEPPDAAQVRARRLAYSAAIAARDPQKMQDYMAEDFVQLLSNGTTTISRQAVIDGYVAQEFRNPDFIAYERIPDTVAISDNGRFAIERGHWRGRFRQKNGRIDGNNGLYQAGWIKRDGVWLVRTESYVRLHCADEQDCPR